MPVILDSADYAIWLAPGAPDEEMLRRLARGAACATLELHPVGRRVNDPRFDDPACLAPAGSPG